jgi:predicted anti-sigma-YlaC factor YlaD
MTCDEYQEQVSQYIDGELKDKDSGTLFKHLSTCGECRSFLRSTLEMRSKIHDEMLMEHEGATNRKKNRLVVIQNKTMKISRVLAGATLAVIILVTAFVTRTISTGTAIEQNREIIYVTSLPTVEVQGFSTIEKNVKQ